MDVALILIITAVVAAVAPLPAAFIEDRYSTSLYAWFQPVVTGLSNRIDVALFDIAAVLILLLLLRSVVRGFRRDPWRAAFARNLMVILGASAAIYLVFLAMWGLNYRRVPLDEKLQYDSARVTRAAAGNLGRLAVREVNALATAPRDGVDTRALEAAFADVQRALGQPLLATPGRPKRSLLGWYFRRAAIDGMTDPFFLEVILNPDLLPVERPAVLAHEWAHLAGYANESEANFVGWLTCIRADPLSRYSGWLEAYGLLANALPREEQRVLRSTLSPAVRADLEAIYKRFEQSSPRVRAVARDAYDTYLRAHRVEEGIASYDAAVRLMLGSGFESGWTPKLR